MTAPQPYVNFPLWDEPLSKITAPLDIVAARWRLARRFNRRPPTPPPAIRKREIERAWRQHHNGVAP